MTTRMQMARSRLRSAQAEVAAARDALDHAAAPWHSFVDRHRSALIIGGGLTGGAVSGLLPPRVWRAVFSALAIGAMTMARSLIVPMLAGSVFARRRTESGATG